MLKKLLLFIRKIIMAPLYAARWMISTAAPVYSLAMLLKVRLSLMVKRLIAPSPKVLIVCENYSSCAGMEALTNEAREVFQHLSNPRKEIISIEIGQIAKLKCEMVKKVSHKEFARTLLAGGSEIIHTFVSDLHLFGLRDLARKKVVVSLSGSDPLAGLEREVFEEIQHLADQGMVYVVPQSEYLANVLNDCGIKSRDIIYPGISIERFVPQVKVHKGFRIGFASSPMETEHYETRGIALIIELARRCKDIEFHLAYRRQPEDIELQAKKIGLNNLIVKTGKLDMVSFYNSVDCVIVPFTCKRKNPEAPLSAIESLACGRPVICTNFVGIADIIGREEAGIVVECEITALEEAVKSMKSMADKLSAKARNVAERHFDVRKIAKRYERLYIEIDQEFETNSLYDWRMNLRSKDKQLVIGREEIKNYYQQKEVAVRYSEDRFEHFPWKELNDLEMRTITAAIDEQGYAHWALRILDVASGNGRILAHMLEYGDNCCGLEVSDAMRQVLKQKFGHLSTVSIIPEDIFQFQTDDEYDLITCIRFLRHFLYKDRKTIYKNIRRCLATNGICIADFPNKRVEVPLRDNIGWESFCIYDVFWDLQSLTSELQENGFHVKQVYGVGKFMHLFNKLPFDKLSGNTLTPILSRHYHNLEMKYLLDSSVNSRPLFWIVCFEKI